MSKLDTPNSSLVHYKGATIVTYHNTNIVVAEERVVTLDSGDYLSVTTKKKMNFASYELCRPFQVWQKNFIWYVTFGGKVYPFSDGMRLTYKSIANEPWVTDSEMRTIDPLDKI